ncbi:small ribosomal subunit protein bS21 [Lacipirellula sp.]|uniref:small ribosomal subunit protein bS21 n=1 Tax=Lacipirellula sp. TaxID=2691419 RepID=UPI003D1364E5
MPGRIEVQEGEHLSSALRRLYFAVRHSSKRQWSKSRPGCYEKPSDLRRRKQATSRRNARRHSSGRSGYNTVYLGLSQLLAPTEPFAGQPSRKRKQRWDDQPDSFAAAQQARQSGDAHINGKDTVA